MLTDTDLARDAQHQIKIAQYAGQLGIENSNNVFFQEVDYSVNRQKPSILSLQRKFGWNQ